MLLYLEDIMDLEYEVKDNKYDNIKDVLRCKFKISSRLFLKLRNSNKIFLNRNSYIFKSFYCPRRYYWSLFRF